MKPNDWLYFNRKEIIGLLIWSILIFVILIIIHFYPNPQSAKIELISTQSAQEKNNINSTTKSKKISPMNASLDDLISIGFPKYIAINLLKYKSKGGKIKTKEDVLKLYGMNDSILKVVLPNLILSNGQTKNFDEFAINNTYGEPDYLTLPKSKFSYKEVSLNLNLADSIQLTQVYGIGKTFASRIVKYRQKIGGFHSIEQLKEVWGLDSSFDQIAPQLFVDSKTPLRPIFVNRYNIDDLATHPYIRYKTAKAIVNFRNQHGKFKNKQDLQLIHLISDSLYQKLEPYISLD
jgi:DNA uptake protein ComE-like DNA-binding protein